MGVVCIAHDWFASYLEGRSQCVDIGGTLSDFMDLAISVIQGSTLGPLLFFCYINDLLEMHNNVLCSIRRRYN